MLVGKIRGIPLTDHSLYYMQHNRTVSEVDSRNFAQVQLWLRLLYYITIITKLSKIWSMSYAQMADSANQSAVGTL